MKLLPVLGVVVAFIGIRLTGRAAEPLSPDNTRFGPRALPKGEWKGRQLILASWLEAATARQTSNGSNPKGRCAFDVPLRNSLLPDHFR